MGKKAHPNLKDFKSKLDHTFEENESGHHVCNDVCVNFQHDSDDWEISFDKGETWHSGKYPSGMNTIRTKLYVPPVVIEDHVEEIKPKKRGKKEQ